MHDSAQMYKHTMYRTVQAPKVNVLFRHPDKHSSLQETCCPSRSTHVAVTVDLPGHCLLCLLSYTQLCQPQQFGRLNVNGSSLLHVHVHLCYPPKRKMQVVLVLQTHDYPPGPLQTCQGCLLRMVAAGDHSPLLYAHYALTPCRPVAGMRGVCMCVCAAQNLHCVAV